jgi:hypothetical protein
MMLPYLATYDMSQHVGKKLLKLGGKVGKKLVIGQAVVMYTESLDVLQAAELSPKLLVQGPHHPVRQPLVC